MASTSSAITTIPQAIKSLAEDNPDKEAFVFIDKHDNRIALSRQEVWNKSQKFANILKRRGIEKGDIVCNTLVNSPERLITAFGTMTAGAITMNGQLLMSHGEDLLLNVRVSECKAIIVDVGVKNSAWTFLQRIAYRDDQSGGIRYRDLPYLSHVIELVVTRDDDSNSKPCPTLGWLHELDRETETFFEENTKAEDMAVVFNTSGTTGFSKLVPYTHGKLLGLIKVFTDVEQKGHTFIRYSNRYLGWIGGFPHHYFTSGCKFVLTNHANGRPENMAAHMVKIFEQEKCTDGDLAGVDVENILRYINYRPLPHLMDSIFVGGGPMASFIGKAINRISKEVVIGYGGTEFRITSLNHIDENSIFQSYCAGVVMPYVEIKIKNDNMDEVKVGEIGEIFSRSPYGAEEYLNDPVKTKESFLGDGWFRTGDLGYQNEKGQLFVLGRKANAIMKGPFIFYPGWLEEQILKCPGIQSVSVIGVPDPIMYEEICVCLIPTLDSNLTEEYVRQFCQDIFITSVKEQITPMPKYFLFLDKFPFNANLKVDSKNLKAQACKILNLKR